MSHSIPPTAVNAPQRVLGTGHPLLGRWGRPVAVRSVLKAVLREVNVAGNPFLNWFQIHPEVARA